MKHRQTPAKHPGYSMVALFRLPAPERRNTIMLRTVDVLPYNIAENLDTYYRLRNATM